MTKIVYVGEAPSTDIVVPGGAVRAVKGEPVDVPEAVAKSLLEQTTFEPAPAGKTKQEKE